jgi:hypothetical protein
VQSAWKYQSQFFIGKAVVQSIFRVDTHGLTPVGIYCKFFNIPSFPIGKQLIQIKLLYFSGIAFRA